MPIKKISKEPEDQSEYTLQRISNEYRGKLVKLAQYHKRTPPEQLHVLIDEGLKAIKNDRKK